MIIEENEFNTLNEEVKKDILKDNYILYGEDSKISLNYSEKNSDKDINIDLNCVENNTDTKVNNSKVNDIINKYKSERLYTTGEIAKELGISSAAKLNNILEDKKIQFKRNGIWMLYSRYVCDGIIVMNQFELECGIKVYDRKWTEKGRLFIQSILINT